LHLYFSKVIVRIREDVCCHICGIEKDGEEREGELMNGKLQMSIDELQKGRMTNGKLQLTKDEWGE
jgi:hypothetical protein